MQMRENSKRNNFDFNTWLKILAREHLPPKLRLERERGLKIQREQRRKRQGQETTEQREHRLAQRTAILLTAAATSAVQ